jgi:heptosyltransferase-2
MEIKYYCRHFRGDIPCRPHKEYGVHCDDCSYYSHSVGRILIIKLGAIGDVIRTTPLLHYFENNYPKHEIWWLTYSPEVLPSQVDKKLSFTLENILTLQNINFDWVINLDKDTYACSLMNSISSEKKSGFALMNGKPFPIDNAAQHKYFTGIFDDISKANKKSYPEEVFELIGSKFSGEEYILEVDNSYTFEIPNEGKKIVGLNTGCGARWTSRLWSEDNWQELIKNLQNKGYYPLLLGGEQEHERNSRLSSATGALYLGYFPLKQFISLINEVDILVTGVTMGLHLGIGLRKKIVLFNNIFNPNEFELYGRGVIIQPEKECKCYFKGKCENPDYFCMDFILPKTVAEAITSF